MHRHAWSWGCGPLSLPSRLCRATAIRIVRAWRIACVRAKVLRSSVLRIGLLDRPGLDSERLYARQRWPVQLRVVLLLLSQQLLLLLMLIVLLLIVLLRLILLLLLLLLVMLLLLLIGLRPLQGRLLLLLLVRL